MSARLPPVPRRSRSRFWWLWHVVPALVAGGMALVAFGLGVDVDGREGMPEAGIFAQLYAVLTLFVLGGLDLGLPTGSTPGARGLLWGAFFLAPAVTTVTVVEAFLASLQPGWWSRRSLRNHVVVVGAGRLGTLYLEALRAEEPRARILLVDRDGSRENVARHFGATFLTGDIRREHTRAELSLSRARGVILMTKDDLCNLASATDIVESSPDLAGKIVVHVADLGLKRTLHREPRVPDSEKGTRTTREHLFNSHRVAAQHLVANKLRAHFALTTASDVVVLAGFGRFGQTILEILQVQAVGEFHAVVVVDIQAKIRARHFAEQVGFGDYRVEIIEGDVNDPDVWDRVRQVSTDVVSPAYVLGTDADSINLRTAVSLRSRHPAARVFARCFDESGFTRRLSTESGFDVSSVADLVRASLREHHHDWFGEL